LDYHGVVDRAFGKDRLATLALMCIGVGTSVVFWFWLAVQFHTLPARIPIHFTAAGVPDAWSPASVAAWFGPPAAGLGVVVILLGAAWLILLFSVRYPNLVNVPFKERWRSLPPQARRWTMMPLIHAFLGAMILVQGVFIYLSWGSLEVARGNLASLPLWPSAVMVGVMLLWILGSIGLVALRIRLLA
jgi:uncharacterized membrane protein